MHPRLDRSTGTWSVDVRLTPGVWRVVADLVPEGWEGITLADDVSVAGSVDLDVKASETGRSDA